MQTVSSAPISSDLRNAAATMWRASFNSSLNARLIGSFLQWRALQPPERCIDQISCGRAINLHRSGFDVAYEIVHVARIARYNGGRKAVLAVVCLIDGVGIVRHLDDCDYRPKNFLACDPHVLRDIRENGGG